MKITRCGALKMMEELVGDGERHASTRHGRRAHEEGRAQHPDHHAGDGQGGAHVARAGERAGGHAGQQ